MYVFADISVYCWYIFQSSCNKYRHHGISFDKTKEMFQTTVKHLIMELKDPMFSPHSASSLVYHKLLSKDKTGQIVIWEDGTMSETNTKLCL